MTVAANDWTAELLDFWFDEIGAKGWWRRSDKTDAAIDRRFGALWDEQRTRDATDFLSEPDYALAAVILFDQFSRNLFRHTAKAYSADSLARAIANAAIERGYDGRMSEDQRVFLYMPFMHSEALSDQKRSLELFAGDKNFKYARDHHDLIARFGRFPHRNDALGRETLTEEKEAVAKAEDW